MRIATLKQVWAELACVLACPAFAQQAAPAGSPDLIFRSSTKLVQLSVIAQDKKTQPVTDLRREEFQIFDNGVPRAIQLFEADTLDAKPALTEARAAAGTFSNQLTAPGGSRSSYSVILFDNLVTGFGEPGEDGTSLGRLKVLHALEGLPKGEKIALYAVGQKLQVVSEFTSDRELLAQQLKKWTPAPDTEDSYASQCGAAHPDSPIAGTSSEVNAPVEQAQARASEECVRIDMLRRLASFQEQIGAIADHLAGIPGRKNLIWMANRFPIAGGPGVQRLMNAGAAVYPVDEAGVCGQCPPRPKEQMLALAGLTGGAAYFDRGDLDTAIREAIEDGRVSYTLGFYKPSEDKAGTVHELRVSVSRPNVTLRYRATYQIDAPAPPSANPVADLVKVMNQPVDATVIPISASATRTHDHLDLKMSYDISTLDLELKEGLWKGTAELVFRFVKADGIRTGDVISQTVTFNLRQATYAAMLRSGAPYENRINIPTKGVELKILVASLATGKIGTLTIPLSEVRSSAKSN